MVQYRCCINQMAVHKDGNFAGGRRLEMWGHSVLNRNVTGATYHVSNFSESVNILQFVHLWRHGNSSNCLARMFELYIQRTLLGAGSLIPSSYNHLLLLLVFMNPSSLPISQGSFWHVNRMGFFFLHNMSSPHPAYMLEFVSYMPPMK